jgi:hypothetical protein
MAFCAVYHLLCDKIAMLEEWQRPNAPATRVEKQRISDNLISVIEQEFYKLGLKGSANAPLAFRIARLDARLRSSGKITAKSLRKELTQIRNDFIQTLMESKFAAIPQANAPYFEQQKLFGDQVYENFPTVRQEIKEAGNCLAANLGTAAVFHLMRVAEKGLRALFRDRAITFSDQNPLHLQNWQSMIESLDSAIENISTRPNPPSLAKVQADEFYTGTRYKFQAFKDVWANQLVHDRSYTVDEARDVLSCVARFMQHLATRISETRTSPLAWAESQVVLERRHRSARYATNVISSKDVFHIRSKGSDQRLLCPPRATDT